MKNLTQIKQIIKIIYDFISKLRQYIAHYYKDMYIIGKLANIGENRRFAIDESLFVQIWSIDMGKKLN